MNLLIDVPINAFSDRQSFVSILNTQHHMYILSFDVTNQFINKHAPFMVGSLFLRHCPPCHSDMMVDPKCHVRGEV